MSVALHRMSAYCPHCEAHLVSEVCLTGEPFSKPGAITLCCECHKFSIYGKDNTLRKLNARDLEPYEQSGVKELLEAVQVMVEGRS